MQTFLPYPDFRKSASVLDKQRLGKQRVEVLQILQTLAKGPYSCWWCGEGVKESRGWSKCCDHKIVKTPWYNHPAVQMWRGYETALAEYGRIVCKEWLKKGYIDTCYDKILRTWSQFDDVLNDPPWLGDERLHSSHRAALLYKNYAHYKQFGWSEKPAVPNNKNSLPYWWPTNEQKISLNVL